MNKLTLCLLVLLSPMLAVAIEQNGPNDQGIYQVFNHNARFKGRLLVDGCRIEPKDVTINLGSMTVPELNSKRFGEWHEGTLQFKDCNLNKENENIKVSGVYLQIPAQNPTPGTTRADLWSNEARNDRDGAKGVSIEMWVEGNRSLQVTPKGTEGDGILANIKADNSASYTVRGRMVRDSFAGELTTGKILTVIYFNVIYK